MHPVQYPGIDLPREAEEWDPLVAGAHFPVPFLKGLNVIHFCQSREKSTCIIADVFHAISILSKSFTNWNKKNVYPVKVTQPFWATAP